MTITIALTITITITITLTINYTIIFTLPLLFVSTGASTTMNVVNALSLHWSIIQWWANELLLSEMCEQPENKLFLVLLLNELQSRYVIKVR